MNFRSIIDWVVLLIPMIIGYSMAMVCKMDKNSGKNINARPPSWVFSVVWPILYLCIGFTWVELRSYGVWVNIMFILNTLILALWIAVYSCGKNKKGALYILVVAIVIAMMIWGISIRVGGIGMYIFPPYIVWLIFALMLNFQEVNNYESLLLA